MLGGNPLKMRRLQLAHRPPGTDCLMNRAAPGFLFFGIISPGKHPREKSLLGFPFPLIHNFHQEAKAVAVFPGPALGIAARVAGDQHLFGTFEGLLSDMLGGFRNIDRKEQIVARKGPISDGLKAFSKRSINMSLVLIPSQ